MNKPVYMEEYKHCSCTQIEHKKSDLMGYCRRHGNDRKYVIKLPNGGDIYDESDLGFVET